MAVKTGDDPVILRDPELDEGDRRIGSLTARSFALLRMTVFLAFLTVTQELSAQLPGQSFIVTPDTAAVFVGDSVTLRFRIRLHERDQPLDSIPQVVGILPAGVRVLSVGQLSRSADRVYEGSARVAFYRPGRRPVPTFALPFMRIVEGVSRATLPSDSAFVVITPILAAGSPALKDIQELERRSLSPWAWLAPAATLIAAAGAFLLLRRRRKRSTVAAEPELRPEILEPGPYDIALERLVRVEEARWPAHGNVARHYESVAQVLRQYLEHAHQVGALERTTSELLWALPPRLSREGLRDSCNDVLGEADLVKFAELRPSDSGAADFLRRARHLLSAWHETGQAKENVDAVR